MNLGKRSNLGLNIPQALSCESPDISISPPENRDDVCVDRRPVPFKCTIKPRSKEAIDLIIAHGDRFVED
jgi:hypothetical protein